MESLLCKYVLLILVLGLTIVIEAQSRMGIKPQFLQKSAEMCKEFGKEPFFDADIVVGKSWRIYHTWNMDLSHMCLDIKFKKLTNYIVQRIYDEMHEYMETQPTWGAAWLLLNMGKGRRELLLFADQGPVGYFHAVPNVMREGSLTPERGTVPLLKFHMKLLQGGKFLVLMDCHIGTVSLAARYHTGPPYRSEINAAASELGIGEGINACVQDKNPNEIGLNQTDL